MPNIPETYEKTRSPSQLPRMANDPFERLRDDVDRVFNSYFRGFNLSRLGFGSTGDGSLLANFDLSETPETIVVQADVPGIKEKDLSITLADDILNIKGKRESEIDEKRKSYHRVERSYGEFQRRIALPCEVDADHVDAKLKDGVLTVTLQKTPRSMEREKKIQVKVS